MAPANGFLCRLASVRQSPARLAMALFVLAVFTFQSYAVQTHVHFTPAELAAVTSMTPGPTTVQSHNDNQPAPDNPATCPLCQEMLHSGSFVMPAAIGALPPGLAFSAVVPALAQRIGLHFLSHNWYGRAPPAV